MTLTSPHVVQLLAPVGGPFAGRMKEMDALRRAWADAVAGHGGMVVLGGQAGVGKSRLAHEFLNEATRSARVVQGACLYPLSPMASGVSHDSNTMFLSSRFKCMHE